MDGCVLDNRSNSDPSDCFVPDDLVSVVENYICSSVGTCLSEQHDDVVHRRTDFFAGDRKNESAFTNRVEYAKNCRNYAVGIDGKYTIHHLDTFNVDKQHRDDCDDDADLRCDFAANRRNQQKRK